jgi:hypothetical protein
VTSRWDLPEDFEFSEAVTPTIDVELAEPGKVTPKEAAAEFLASSQVSGGSEAVGTAASLERETLEAMLDEKLARQEIKELQSGYRTPTASTSGSRCSRTGCRMTTRSCCRWGRG